MLPFILELRQAGIPISVRYVLEFYRALQQGLAPDVDRLFVLARLVFVKRVEHYDLFERVFGAYFLGKGSFPEDPDWKDLLGGKPFEEWLRDQIAAGKLPPDALRQFSNEDLLARFWETLLAQQGAHHGGNTWVGTRGRSPYGHGGRHGGGIRVHGDSLHGTAQKVIARRNYVDYSDKATMGRGNLRQVLASLKNLQAVGPESELNVDETIARTAKNGGEIELVFARELRDRLKLVVLLDNGGYSMMPYVELVRTVFGRMQNQFRELKTYYFHNCIYGTVYLDPARTRPLPWERLCGGGQERRLIIIGDANMAPSELMAANGAISIYTTERKPGREWLRELKSAFPVSVWLNPIPKNRWGLQSATIDQIGRIFYMEDVTLAGIKNAVDYLNIQGQAFRAA
ncbi:MAG TPA: hypothetical protein DCE18_01335 [Syntrophobacteraceae bacterium]|jgi:uncharacterized protein|nr:hypothetical protein [Syntrophobacteraceae bacterium]HBZ53928.1 hypothetical protein [Syntrophobacteraceae bacterium]